MQRGLIADAVTLPKGEDPDATAIQNIKDHVWIDHRQTGHFGPPNLEKLLKVSPGLQSSAGKVDQDIGYTCATCRIGKAVNTSSCLPAS
jgi:hypothetical protein